MCGFVGINRRLDHPRIEHLYSLIAHRGPDARGAHLGEEITLVHRRLSIIDLKGGAQPLFNDDASCAIVFNGELYNYREERAVLEQLGYKFRTGSDTEVVLRMYEHYGHEAPKRMNGEFAFAIWDNNKKIIFLARDHFGVKPLFYYLKNGEFIFSSEIKAILSFPSVTREINAGSLERYFSYRYNFGEETIFDGICNFPPAHYGVYDGKELKVTRYYQVNFGQIRISLNQEDAVRELRARLEEAVRSRLVADVEVGMFLSSGIDSVTVLHFMRKFQQKVRTFTLGFGLSSDETTEAKKIAESFGAQNTTITISPNASKEFPSVVQKFDQPIGDSIILPTYFLAKTAGSQVKSVLTGEGADEIFAGYIHQLAFFYFEKYLRHMPQGVLGFLSAAVRKMPLTVLNRMFPYPESLRGHDREKVARLFRVGRDFYSARRQMTSLFPDNEFAGPGLIAHADNYLSNPAANNFFFDAVNADLNAWLPDYTLYKQDTLTMANSLEGRVPFLDHRLVDFAASLPFEWFIQGSQVKMPLRLAMRGILPQSVVNAKKQAFYFPYARFFKQDFFKEITHSYGNRLPFDDLLSHAYFDRLIARYPGLSLVEQKQLMVYTIFLIWYNYHFHG